MTPSDQDPLLGLPFDLYEPYMVTARLIGLLYPGEDRAPLRVLDVGGPDGALDVVLPNEDVEVVEPSAAAVPGPADEVRAVGSGLPFPDGEFDLVTAHDALQNVAPDLRSAFLGELVRVSRGFVILNGPIYQPETAWSQRLMSQLVRSMGPRRDGEVTAPPHVDLPDREAIEGLLAGRGLAWEELPNGDLWLWVALQAARALASAGYPAGELSETVNRILNRWPSLGSEAKWYRRAYVVAVEPSRAASLAGVEDLRGKLGLLKAFVRPAELTERISREAELSERIEELETVHGRVVSSVTYRLMERIQRGMAAMAPWGTRRRSLFLTPARAVRVIMNRGWAAFLRELLRPWRWVPNMWSVALPKPERLTWDERYELWLGLEVLGRSRLRELRRKARRLTYRPLVSIVMPVHDPEPGWLHAAIESVREQVYDNWELCIADDGSVRSEVREMLQTYARRDRRITATRLARNRGISAASNAALEMAEGEFVGFLDHDDELKPNALYEVVRALNEDRELDFVYSDADKMELDGRLTEAFFRPDWSPDLLTSVNYVTHFSVYRRQVIEAVGGLRSAFDGSQDYDLALRVTERTDRIAHVPLPLYSWRKVPGSAAASLDFKSYAYGAGARALEDALRRRGFNGSVEEGLVEGRYRVRYPLRGSPKVVVVIPTRDRLDLLEPCIESIRIATAYPNYEIMVVDNLSEDPETLRYLEAFPGRVMRWPHRFNFARMINAAVGEVGDADFLLFLNNDTEVIAPEWIEAMVEHGQRGDVAAVGARLLFPDGRPQHEGIVIGLEGAAARNVDHEGYFDLGETVRNCSAVTAACMLTRPEVFRELGGFEERLAVAYNDVDFCLRAREKGYQIVYTPYALLYHDEGSSRGLGGSQSAEDESFFRRRWEGYRDPYYNASLNIDRAFDLPEVGA